MIHFTPVPWYLSNIACWGARCLGVSAWATLPHLQSLALDTSMANLLCYSEQLYVSTNDLLYELRVIFCLSIRVTTCLSLPLKKHTPSPGKHYIAFGCSSYWPKTRWLRISYHRIPCRDKSCLGSWLTALKETKCRWHLIPAEKLIQHAYL